MHPIERLRWIAQADGEAAATVAAEAAWTLGELGAEDPAAVLTASRRLVERQPTCGPLWWVCAQLVAAEDTVATAHSVAAELVSDTVADRLADALRSSFTSSDQLCTLAPVHLLAHALGRRGTYSLRLIAAYHFLRHELRALGATADDVTGFEHEEAAEAVHDAAVVLVEPHVALGSGLLVEPADAKVIELACAEGVPVWALLPAGRLLSDELAAAAMDLAGDSIRLVGVESLTAAVDESGLGDARSALSKGTCPPAFELTRRVRRPPARIQGL